MGGGGETGESLGPWKPTFLPDVAEQERGAALLLGHGPWPTTSPARTQGVMDMMLRVTAGALGPGTPSQVPSSNQPSPGALRVTCPGR